MKTSSPPVPHPKLRLTALLDLLDFDRAGYTAVLDLETGEAVIMEARLVAAARKGDRAALARVPEWQIPDAELARVIARDTGGKRFIAGPDKTSFHEQRHMELFIGTVANEAHAEQLWRAIEGEEASYQFKETVDRLDLLDRWFTWRDTAMKAYVREWAEGRGFQIEA